MLRPDSIKVTPKEGTIPPKLILIMRNTGQLPAFRISSAAWASDQELVKNPPYKHEGPTFDLGPDEIWYSRATLTDAHYVLFQNKTLYYGIQITYTDKNNIDGLYEIKGHISSGDEVFDDVIMK